ncbi:fibroblast growth factor receptor-like 1 isoform X2 [Stegodyphus dumicola]|uniref:fibroblast growth factor receptor-like 1 isoform X2 n=1 Tax=Stegodyphus dumicola TaxID=202533 RepID=UPI0015A8B9A1|nr:fibroblast growth factor receptor-like 1 isoform X2 [Stegodyphus dumicola]
MENEPKPIFCILPWVSFICLAAALNSLGPPRLVPEAYEMERVVPEGAKVQLPCPVQADPDTLFFEWYHGKEPLNIFHEDRFRVQSNGVLKIKAAVPEDSGLYICRAVNGFGKLDTNVTLVVLVAPFLTNVTRTNNGRLRRPLGGTLRLYCKASGNPEPQVTWLRNGLTLLNITLPPGWKRSRWSLYLRNLQDHDEGNYTCIAYNLYGHANYTVGVDVIPGIRKKPELRGIHPINTTVEEGGSAVFQCRVKSEIIPHVQWLKQAEPDEINDHKVIKVHGEYFKILKSSEVLERADGSFVNKLVIAGVSKKDAGKYICLGANSMGYSFRSAFLTIRETSETYIAEMEGIESDDLSVQFNTLLITIPVSLGILITFLAFLGLHYYCYYYKPRNGNPGLHGNSSRKTETAPQPACPTVNEVSIMGSPDFHRVLESSDGTWSHVQSSLVIDPAQPDSFSECDSSFVFLGDLNVYPDIIYKDRGQILGLYSPNIPIPEKMSCLDRV